MIRTAVKDTRKKQSREKAIYLKLFVVPVCVYNVDTLTVVSLNLMHMAQVEVHSPGRSASRQTQNCGRWEGIATSELVAYRLNPLQLLPKCFSPESKWSWQKQLKWSAWICPKRLES